MALTRSATEMERVPLAIPPTRAQMVVAVLIAMNRTHAEVASEMHITVSTVRFHLYALAKKIPGDLPAEQRVVAWVRGASEDVLRGTSLKLELLDQVGALDAPIGTYHGRRKERDTSTV